MGKPTIVTKPGLNSGLHLHGWSPDVEAKFGSQLDLAYDSIIALIWELRQHSQLTTEKSLRALPIHVLLKAEAKINIASKIYDQKAPNRNKRIKASRRWKS